MEINNLKIGLQLKIGFGIIIFLIVVLGAISWRQSNLITQQTTDIYEHPMKVRRALGNINSGILSIRLEYRNMILAKEPSDKQTAASSIFLAKDEVENNFNIVSDQYLGPPSDVSEAHQSYLKWILLIDRGQEYVLKGNIQEALKNLDQSSDLYIQRDLMLRNIKIIDDFALSKSDQLFNNSKELKKSLDKQLITFLSLILVLSFVIILLLIKNIHRPLLAITQATKQFGEGNLDIRSSFSSHNELGSLSSSFNNLAETIQEEFSFKERSVKMNTVMLQGFETKNFLLQLLEPLMQLTGSQVAAIFILNEQKTSFEHLESIGMPANGHKSFSAKDYEGEFGKALVSKKIEHTTHISNDSKVSFVTVSGVLMPKEIVTIPIIDKQEVIAMISLSTLQSYDKITMRLIDNMMGALSAWMNAMLANQRIQKMSVNLRIQNQELESQKKELSVQTNELFEQNAELEMQKRQLAESNQMKSSFLSNMSHELRTPLNSVIALSGVLNRRLANKIPAEEFSYLDVIERNGKLLLSLINDILDLSRIEAGFEEFKASKFEIKELIEEVVELIEPQAKHKRIGLSCHLGDSLPTIQSDYEKCRHILQNIIANAIKFTEVGEVMVTADSDSQFIKIDVRDTGIGIGEEFLTTIFEEFRQADNSNARKYGGTGLGLSIAKKYTKFIGGNITVTSEKGKGSVFTITLPIEPGISYIVNTEEVRTYSHDEKDYGLNEVSRQSKSEKTILIVEDSEAIVLQLKDILQAEGYNYLVARNGKEALEQIERQMPDAMILDLMMPEVDGFEVLKNIRGKEETSRIPVIILTAKYVTKEELSFLKHNHVHQLIQKGDINKEQLIGAVTGMTFPKQLEVSKNKPMYNTPLKPITGTPVILIVEDNPDNLLTVKALLEDIGTIIGATNGLEGLEKAIIHQPHLILMDIALPGMNGIETLAAVRKEESLKHIPIIALSASAMKGDREQFLAFGFNEYVSKPIDNDHLMTVINRHLPLA